MQLSELFSYLTYGELANLKVGGKDEGGIHPTYSNEVISYINQGLTDLHTRFDLKTNECIVQLIEEVTRYHLTSAHAYSNMESEEPYKYIDDFGQYPFEDDIIRIEQVFNEIGQELIFNSEDPECTVFAPQYNVLQVTNPEDDNAISVVYKADHAPISLENHADPSSISIDIPSSLIDPLCMFVAAKAHNAVGTPESINSGFTKMQQYEATCLGIEIRGVINTNTYINNRLSSNGWV